MAKREAGTATAFLSSKKDVQSVPAQRPTDGRSKQFTRLGMIDMLAATSPRIRCRAQWV